jgi:hypothetical protein
VAVDPVRDPAARSGQLDDARHQTLDEQRLDPGPVRAFAHAGNEARLDPFPDLEEDFVHGG